MYVVQRATQEDDRPATAMQEAVQEGTCIPRRNGTGYLREGLSKPKLNNMITLNKWRQKCLDKINRQFRISEFSNIKLYSAILSGMFRRVDDELEMARKETTLRMRDVHLKRMQEQLMDMLIFIVGFIVRTEKESRNVEVDIERLLMDRLGEYSKKEEKK